MAQKPRAKCEESNAAVLSPVNLIFLLNNSLSILAERVSQEISKTHENKGIYLRGSFQLLLLIY